MAEQINATVIQPITPRISWRDYVPVIALILTVCGALLVGGQYISQVKDNTRRIEALERRVDEQGRDITDLKTRLASIDGKLDILLNRVPERRVP